MKRRRRLNSKKVLMTLVLEIWPPIDRNRILGQGVGLELACNGGKCGGESTLPVLFCLVQTLVAANAVLVLNDSFIDKLYFYRFLILYF